MVIKMNFQTKKYLKVSLKIFTNDCGTKEFFWQNNVIISDMEAWLKVQITHIFAFLLWLRFSFSVSDFVIISIENYLSFFYI